MDKKIITMGAGASLGVKAGCIKESLVVHTPNRVMFEGEQPLELSDTRNDTMPITPALYIPSNYEYVPEKTKQGWQRPYKFHK